MMYVLVICLGLIIGILAIIISTLYGMDLGMGYCDNFVDWIRKEHRLNKEIAEELKAEKAFLKVNPICEKCRQNGKLRKAVYCDQEETKFIPVCEEHHRSQYEECCEAEKQLKERNKSK